MKIVIAPDSFKESLTAMQAAHAIASGIEQVLPEAECVCLPMADGGEGTAKTLCDLENGRWRTLNVTGPLGTPVAAGYAQLPNGQAVIEMAEAAGLHHVPTAERNPSKTTTYGVGELILDALNQGATDIVLGIGGSATNDGGSGMLAALGAKLLDADGKLLTAGGGALAGLATVSLSGLDPRLQNTRIAIACDVDNPLLGTRGASAVFAPQKGADASMVERLDAALAHYAELMVAAGFADHRLTAGSGAAGGLGFALLGLPNSELEAGIELVMRHANLATHCQTADLVITGEGRMDGQTLSGKVPAGVLSCAKPLGVPVIALCGVLDDDEGHLNELGFTAIFPIISKLTPLEEALAHGEQNLHRTARQVAEVIKMRNK